MANDILAMCEETLVIVNRQLTGQWSVGGYGPPKKLVMPKLQITPNVTGDKFYLTDTTTQKNLFKDPLGAEFLLSFLLGMVSAYDSSTLIKLTEE